MPFFIRGWVCSDKQTLGPIPYHGDSVPCFKSRRQVSWLPDLPTPRAFPSQADSGNPSGFVPGYSGGSAAALHRLSLFSPTRAPTLCQSQLRTTPPAKSSEMAPKWRAVFVGRSGRRKKYHPGKRTPQTWYLYIRYRAPLPTTRPPKYHASPSHPPGEMAIFSGNQERTLMEIEGTIVLAETRQSTRESIRLFNQCPSDSNGKNT
jgi:hypothetical protein